jgi:TolA-binding protein
VTELSRVLERYPRSNKAPDALMKMGMAHEKLGRPDLARRAFQKVLDTYPQSALADLARARLGTLATK